MGVRRTYQAGGLFGISGSQSIQIIPQANKKILIERILISLSTTSVSATRTIKLIIQSQINTSIQWTIYSYSSSATSSSLNLALAYTPLVGFSGSITLQYPLILTSNDVLNIVYNPSVTTGDSYLIFIEYLEMDLDEEIWQ